MFDLNCTRIPYRSTNTKQIDKHTVFRAQQTEDKCLYIVTLSTQPIKRFDGTWTKTDIEKATVFGNYLQAVISFSENMAPRKQVNTVHDCLLN